MTTVIASLAILANSFGVALPFLLAKPVAAAPNGDVIVRPSSLNGWGSTGASGGTANFVADVSAPFGTGALELTTTNSASSRARREKSISPNVKLSELTTLSYVTKYVSGPSYAGAALQITINGLTGVSSSSSTTLVYEPYWNGTVDTAGNWQSWNTLLGGKFWSTNTVAGFTKGSGGPPFYTIEDVKTAHPNAKITSIKVNIGTDNENWIVRTDGVNFNGTIYDFEQNLPTPVLNAENFNTVDDNYQGISVGFNTKDFGTVSAVEVEIERADGSTVTKTGNQGVFDIISNTTTTQQLTAPFVIEEGTFTEASDTFYWNPAPATWDETTTPVKATIRVTDQNGTKTAVITSFSQGAPSWPAYLDILPPPITIVPITGNTAAGENQPGWLFNRDITTSTAFSFNADQASIGNGSVYAGPISNTNYGGTPGVNPNWDKFVGENFIAKSMGDVEKISYDFKIGSGGDAGDKDHFYMTVYANFSESSQTKFYDCRYNVIPVTGSTSSWTTVVFNPSQTYTVATHGSSPQPCPTSPAAMGSDAHIRAFSINMGDTSANDMALDGYFDNVVVRTASEITIYDFEPFINTAPTISFETPTPDEGSTVSGIITPHVLATDDHGMSSYYIRLWKGAFESGSANLVYNDCSAAPGGYNLGTSQDVTCPSIDTTLLEDGTYVLSAQFLDGNNAWAQALRTFMVDNYPPAVPTNLSWMPQSGSAVVSGSSTNAQKGTLTWQDTDPDVNHYKYYFWTNIPGYFNGESNAWTTEGPAYITKSPAGGSIWTDFYDKEGTYFFCVKAIDASGNTSECSEVFSITYDNTAPEAPVHLSPADNSIQSYNTFWFDWTDVSDAVSYEFQSSQSNSTDANGALNVNVWSGDASHNQPTESRVWSAGATGTWFWQVRAVDTAGNKSAWTNPWKMTIDMTAPGVPVITSPVAEQYFNSTPILNKWTTVTDNTGVAGYQIAYHYDDNHSFGGSTCPGEIISGITVSGCRDTSATQRNHTPGTIEQGGVTIWVRAIDLAGNKSAWSAPVHYYYDATPPAAPTITMSEQGGDVIISGYTNSYYVITSWPAVEGATSYQYRYSNSIPGDAYNAPNYYDVLGASTAIPGEFNRGEGLHHVQVRAVDAAGNWSGWSNVLNIIYDATPPTVAITSHADGETVSGAIDITGEIHDTNPDISSIKITGPDDYEVIDTYNDGRLLHTYAWDTTSLPDGVYTLIFSATDKAGNQSTETISLTVDNTAPVLTINTLASSTNQTPTITGTVDDPAATVKVSINGGIAENAVVTGTAWSYAVTTPLGTGTHTITASAVDTQGNTTNPEPSITYTVTAVSAFQGVAGVSTDSPNGNASANSGTNPNQTAFRNAAGRGSANGNANNNSGVLAAETNESNSNDTNQDNNRSGLDQGTTLAANESQTTKGCGKVLGICWYWWIPIVVVILGGIYYFTSRRAEEK